jgi:hypothetical protein
MNYTEIYKRIYDSLIFDGYTDDHQDFDIIQVTRDAASQITRALWSFLLLCENHSTVNLTNEIGTIVQEYIQSSTQKKGT